MKRRLLALATVTTLTIGFLAFGLFGSATSTAANGLARAFGASVELVTGSGSTALVAPLPSISADKANPQAEQALVRIADQPAGPASLIEEIAALYLTARVDVASETAIATSDTARVALLESPDVAAAAAALPGLGLNDLLGLVGSIGNLKTSTALATSPTIVADALHGIVNLSCPQLETLRTSTTSLQRLQAITNGSLAQQVKIKGLLDTAVAPDILANLNKLQDNEFDSFANGKERASAFSLRVNLPAIDVLGIKEGTRLLEINIYEVNADNLTTPNLAEATVRASVDMLHVTVFDRLSLLPEVDLKVGHAEASLTNCARPADIQVVKLVSRIGGVPAISQVGLTAKPGDEIVYALTVANRSLRPCVITSVVDQIPAGLTYLSTSGDLGAGTFDAATNRVTWSGLSIATGGTRTQAVRIKVPSTVASGIYVNRATAITSCGDFPGESPGIQVLGNITVDVTKTVESIAGKTITSSTPRPLTAKVGNEVLYKIAIANSSDESCTISQVVDQLPGPFRLAATTGDLGAGIYDAEAGTITWDNLEIAPGETAEQGLLANIGAADSPGPYRNSATATGSCGTFQGISEPITIPLLVKGVIITRGETPRTGIHDTLMWFGPLFLVAAAAGVSALRRSR